MATIESTDKNFDTLLKDNKILVVDFWASWCAPCKQIAPILEEISNEMNNEVVIAKHNIDDHPNQASKYGIKGIPTMLIFNNGELKNTHVGASSKSVITSFIKANI